MCGKESTMTVNPSGFQAWTFGQATLTENAACTSIGGTVAWWHGFAPKADGIVLGFQGGSKMNYAYLRNTNCISLCLHHKLLLGEVDLKPLPCWQLHESRPYLDKDRLLDLEPHPVKWSLNDNRPFCKPMTIWLVFPCSILQNAATFNNETGVWALLYICVYIYIYTSQKNQKCLVHSLTRWPNFYFCQTLAPWKRTFTPPLQSVRRESKLYLEKSCWNLGYQLCRNPEFRRKCINNSYHWSYTKTGSLPGFWANYELSPNTTGAGEHCIKTKSPSHSVALPHSGSPANHGGIACIVAWQVYVYTNILDDRTSYCPQHVSHWHNHLHRTGSALSN